MKSITFSLPLCCSALAAAITLGGCASMMSGYQKAANAHGNRFTVHKDSAEACWMRAQSYLEGSFGRSLPIIEATDSRIRTAPALTPGSMQIILTQEQIGDSVEIKVEYEYTKINSYDIFGPSSAVEKATDIAFHAHTGWQSHTMPKTLVPGYVAGNPLDPEKDAPKEGSIWGGTSYGKRNWGVEAGARYRFIGASMVFADLRNPGESTPEYVDTEIPHSSYTTESFAGSYLGWNLYGFWDISENLAVFGFGGYYYRPHINLDRSTVTGTYWRSSSATTYSETGFGGGAGVHYGVNSWLMLGAGFSSINGGLLHIGGRF